MSGDQKCFSRSTFREIRFDERWGCRFSPRAKEGRCSFAYYEPEYYDGGCVHSPAAKGHRIVRRTKSPRIQLVTPSSRHAAATAEEGSRISRATPAKIIRPPPPGGRSKISTFTEMPSEALNGLITPLPLRRRRIARTISILSHKLPVELRIERASKLRYRLPNVVDTRVSR